MNLQKAEAPRLPDAPPTYSVQYQTQLLNVLRLFFNRLTARQPLVASQLNIDINTLPTQADLSDLRTGDVYRDTTAGDVLKVKT